MTLSDKIFGCNDGGDITAIFTEDVRKAVLDLKETIVENDIYTADELFRLIKEKFGDKLT